MKTIPIVLLFLLLGFGCAKTSGPDVTRKTLYDTYKEGELSECKHNGSLIYVACINGYDAPTVIYDQKGEKIGQCSYATGQIDQICHETSDCEVFYRCANHISGQPAVDKYGLAK
jgi:hypothetical protein